MADEQDQSFYDRQFPPETIGGQFKGWAINTAVPALKTAAKVGAYAIPGYAALQAAKPLATAIGNEARNKIDFSGQPYDYKPTGAAEAYGNRVMNGNVPPATIPPSYGVLANRATPVYPQTNFTNPLQQQAVVGGGPATPGKPKSAIDAVREGVREGVNKAANKGTQVPAPAQPAASAPETILQPKPMDQPIPQPAAQPQLPTAAPTPMTGGAPQVPTQSGIQYPEEPQKPENLNLPNKAEMQGWIDKQNLPIEVKWNLNAAMEQGIDPRKFVDKDGSFMDADYRQTMRVANPEFAAEEYDRFRKADKEGYMDEVRASHAIGKIESLMMDVDPMFAGEYAQAYQGATNRLKDVQEKNISKYAAARKAEDDAYMKILEQRGELAKDQREEMKARMDQLRTLEVEGLKIKNEYDRAVLQARVARFGHVTQAKAAVKSAKIGADAQVQVGKGHDEATKAAAQTQKEGLIEAAKIKQEEKKPLTPSERLAISKQISEWREAVRAGDKSKKQWDSDMDNLRRDFPEYFAGNQVAPPEPAPAAPAPAPAAVPPGNSQQQPFYPSRTYPIPEGTKPYPFRRKDGTVR